MPGGRLIAISNERVGDGLFAQGNLDAAMTHYRVGRKIVSRLAKVAKAEENRE
jgi:hypothetical protein